MSRFAVMDPETGDWVETTEEAIRLGVTLTREPGLREAATRFVNHVQEVSCDHAPHRGTHTSCPEVLALVAALASEDRP